MLHECGIPVVLLDKTIDTAKYTTITIDDEEAGREAASYLIDHGHTRCVGVFGDQRQRISNMRLKGFTRAHAERAIPLAETQILRVTMIDELEEQLDRAFAAHPDLTAIFTMTDELLVHTHHLLSRRGTRIPEDVSLLAISDGQAPSFLHPNVTHLRHSGVEVGERTAHILIGMIEHNSDAMMDVRIRTTLVELGSVATRNEPAKRRAETRFHATDVMSLIALALFAQLAAPAKKRCRSWPFPSGASTTAPRTRATRRASFATRPATRCRSTSTRAPIASCTSGPTRRTRASASRRAAPAVARRRCSGPATARWCRARGRTRTLEHALVANEPRIDIGWFLLGSMRVERDLQYADRQKSAFADAPFALPELDGMLAALAALEPAERQRHLALLHASSVDALRARLRPTLTSRAEGSVWVTRVTQPALDGLDTLVMELRTDPASGDCVDGRRLRVIACAFGRDDSRSPCASRRAARRSRRSTADRSSTRAVSRIPRRRAPDVPTRRRRARGAGSSDRCAGSSCSRPTRSSWRGCRRTRRTSGATC